MYKLNKRSTKHQIKRIVRTLLLIMCWGACLLSSSVQCCIIISTHVWSTVEWIELVVIRLYVLGLVSILILWSMAHLIEQILEPVIWRILSFLSLNIIIRYRLLLLRYTSVLISHHILHHQHHLLHHRYLLLILRLPLRTLHHLTHHQLHSLHLLLLIHVCWLLLA
jgi:hypothetical protein